MYMAQMAGIGSASSAIWITAGISFMYFLACFIGVGLVERLGRRKLLLASLGNFNQFRGVPKRILLDFFGKTMYDLICLYWFIPASVVDKYFIFYLP